MEIGFRGHNIRLDDDHKPMGDYQLNSESAYFSAILKSIGTFVPGSLQHPENFRVADLACMEGGYSVAMSRLGFNTLGIEARKSNLLRANYAKLKLGIPNLEFVLDDVRNIANYGTFDITLCLGILYHLDDPAAFLKSLYRQTEKVLIVHSFVAPEKEWLYPVYSRLYRLKKYVKKLSGFKKSSRRFPGVTDSELLESTSYIQHVKNYRLGKYCKQNGYAGRWFNEWDKETSKQQVEDIASAAYNNAESFWMCKKDLLHALYDAGFQGVYEQLDDIHDLSSKAPGKYYERTLLIAVKNSCSHRQ